MTAVLLIAVLCMLTSEVVSQQEGWKMTDRFYGFRFSLTGPSVHGVGMRNHVVSLADKYSCFGWVQNVKVGPLNSVVGEVRCAKKYGPIVQEAITSGPYPESADVSGAEVKVYEDTKIKLHFSHFKILNDERKTCFRDQPHQCKEFREGGEDKIEGEGGKGGTDEL
ncbi:hypothetical protein TrRE_jg6575 [Triparma retinervis]|uniref:acylphosphatase n=1 Tax=Triparma retinervis TaxID=2557542 RepID=A0A9W7FDQ2_9STRA|nr:hypothetical protein TrRE_jg6575 [Triparma retinervis]